MNDSSLIAKRISSRQHFLCASPSYIEQHGKPETINDLKQHNCLLGSADFWLFADKKVRISGNMRCNSGLGLVDAALKVIGIVQLPEDYIAEHINTGELITLLEQQQRAEEGIWALYPQNKYLASKVKLLINFLQENLLSA